MTSPEQPRPHIVFTMTGACGLSGGIATANLNILQALVDLLGARGGRLSVLSFLETNSDRPPLLPEWVSYDAFEGSKLALATRTLRFAPFRPLYVFDYVGLALPLLPLAASGLVKTVIFAHGWEYWKQVRTTHRWCIEAATLNLANSEFTLKKMRANLDHFTAEACPMGLSPEFPLNSEIPGPSSDRLALRACDGEERVLGACFLLLVARMSPTERQKGHYEMLQIAPELLERHPQLQFVFPGTGSDRESFVELSKERGVASAVFFPGHVSVETLKWLYRNCFAFVMPSTQEGFGFVYLEAMNYGKPCVACFDQAPEDIIVHGESGLLVGDRKNLLELSDTVRALLKDPNQAQAMGRNGFERLHSNFTSAHYQARIKDQIAKLL